MTDKYFISDVSIGLGDSQYVIASDGDGRLINKDEVQLLADKLNQYDKLIEEKERLREVLEKLYDYAADHGLPHGAEMIDAYNLI